MISVSEALTRICALAAPVGIETVPLLQASGRVLAEDAVARRTQPPFPASAMDGYAVARADAVPGDSFDVIGEAVAGRAFDGSLGPGQAVRIFTGAPVPPGGARVLIQEDITREGDRITLGETPDTAHHIRPAGVDFTAGFRLTALRRLTAHDIALLAAMNLPEVTVRRRPEVAILCTGDELVLPGEDPGPDQIVASNGFGLAAMLENAGASAHLLPVARDNAASLTAAFGLAEGADLVVTAGGASVGDHDLIGGDAGAFGIAAEFHRIAMRPGKPVLAGRIGDAAFVGLPGNPVSSLVCAHVLLRPMIDVFLGLPAGPAPTQAMPLAAPLGKNGPRQHYMRARRAGGAVELFASQDSSLLSVLARADCLVVRVPNAPEAAAGDLVDILPF